MLTSDFAKSIRDKYPDGVTSEGVSYADMSDKDLVGKIVEKYPVYKKQIEDLPFGGAFGNPIEAVKEFGSDLVGAVKERGSNIAETFKSVGEEKPPVENVGDALKETADVTLRKPLRIVGQAAGLIGDVEMAEIKLIAPKFAEDLAAKGMEKISETELVQNVTQKIDEFKQAHPEAAQDIEDVINIASLFPELKAAQLAAKGGTKAVGTISRFTDDILDANRITRIADTEKEINDVVGQIIQGSKADKIKGRKALSIIDTTDVKTADDLIIKMNDGVEALANKVDESLEQAGKTIGPLKTNQLVTTTQVGEKSIQQNFVKDALDQMEETYKTIKDAPSQAKITNLKNKLETEGLSLRELNDLSRDYGKEIKKKAFNPKTGEALTSLNAQAFENTRKGIKNVVRNSIGNEQLKDIVTTLDEKMSNLLNTSMLMKNFSEKANRLYQKAVKRGFFEKASMKIADVIDKASLRTVSGFISRMIPSNVGNKQLNYIRLEENLSKNLKRLDKLMDAPANTFNNQLLNFIIENGKLNK